MNSRLKMFFSNKLIRAAKVIGLVLVTLLVTLTMVALFVWHSESFRVHALKYVFSSINQNENISLNVNGISSPSIQTITLQSIDFQSPTAPHVRISGAKIEWSPIALFRKHIKINTLHAQALSIENNKQAKDIKTPPSEISFSQAMNLPLIEVNSLNVKEVTLLGYIPANIPEIVFSVKGYFDIKNDLTVSSRFDVKQLREGDTSFSIELNTNKMSSLHLKGDLKESPNGLVGQLLKLPQDHRIDAGFDIQAASNEDSYSVSLNTLKFPIFDHQCNITGKAILKGRDFFEGKSNYEYSIEDLSISVDESTNTLHGDGSQDYVNLHISMQKFPLTTLTPFLPHLTQGWVNTTSTITGSYQNPQFNGEILGQLQYKGKPFAFQYHGEANKSKIHAQSLTLKPAVGKLTGKGSIDFSSAIMDVDIEAEKIDFRAFDVFYSFLPNDVSGNIVNLKGQLKGALNNPNGTATGNLNIHYKNQSYRTVAKVKKNDNAIDIDKLKVTTAIGELSATGVAYLDDNASNIKINARDLNVEDLSNLNVPVPPGFKGKINSTLTVLGKLRSPEFSADLEFEGEYKNIPLTLTANGEKNSDIIDLRNLTIMSNGETILSSHAELKNDNISAELQSNKLPTDLLSAVGIQILSGEFISDISITGKLYDPIIEGSYSYASKTFGYNKKGEKKEIKFKWEVDIATSDDAYTVNSFFTRNNHTPGNMHVNINKAPYFKFLKNRNFSIYDIPTQLTINGNIDLQTISFLLDPERYRIIGQINTGLKIDGTIGTPIINGQVNISDARYENPITGTTISNTNCNINIKNQQFSIEFCESNNGSDGIYSLAGSVTPPSDKDRGNIDLEVNLDNANIIRRKDIESEVKGKVTLKGNFDNALAAGKLEVSPLTLNIGARNTRTIPTIQVSEMQSKAEAPSKGYLPALDLDITLFANNQAFVRGRGLDAELSGNVSLSGNASSPKYDGKFETIRGVLKLFNKKFILQEGVITFANDAVSLNISAEYTKGEQRVRATLYGTNNDIYIDLSATPQMQEDEILAYIIFGKPLKDVTAIEAVQLASAVQTLRGDNSGFDPIESTRRALGVDSFTIESANTEEGEYGVNIGVGKYINEKVYLELERTPNPAQPWKGSIEIELTPNINLESSTGGQTGIEGVELKWKKDY